MLRRRRHGKERLLRIAVEHEWEILRNGVIFLLLISDKEKGVLYEKANISHGRRVVTRWRIGLRSKPGIVSRRDGRWKLGSRW
jgi:hypothetical protein